EDAIRDDLVTGVQTCALPICKIRQGVTTEVLGEGRSAGPLKGQLAARKFRARGQEFTWDTLGGYLDAVEKAKVSVNVASYVGMRSEERRVGRRWRGGRAVCAV